MNILILIVILLICIGGYFKIKEKSEYQQYLKEAEDEVDIYQKKLKLEINAHEQLVESLSMEFGNPNYDECVVLPVQSNISFRDSISYNHYAYITVFENASKILIDDKVYNFKDILGYSLVDDASNETITTSIGTAKTSTSNMLGRAIVGGMLTGGLGAVAGAATAKKNITDNATSQTCIIHNFTLHININSLQEPIISLRIGEDSVTAQRLAGVINVIIERNKA
jgi:hypothetical protein